MNVYRIHVNYGKSFLVVAPSYCEAVQGFGEWEASILSRGAYEVASIEFIGEAVNMTTSPTMAQPGRPER